MQGELTRLSALAKRRGVSAARWLVATTFARPRRGGAPTSHGAAPIAGISLPQAVTVEAGLAASSVCASAKHTDRRHLAVGWPSCSREPAEMSCAMRSEEPHTSRICTHAQYASHELRLCRHAVGS